MRKSLISILLCLLSWSSLGFAETTDNSIQHFIGHWQKITCQNHCFELTISNINDQYILQGHLRKNDKINNAGSFKLKLINNQTLEVAEIIQDNIGNASGLIGAKITQQDNILTINQQNQKSIIFRLMK